MKIIYDFGANNGDDLPYYLRKADIVVAVEADPSLCKVMNERFRNEIVSGRAFIENCVIAVDAKSETLFYIHKSSHVLNQFPRPSESELNSYTEVVLPARSPVSIIQQYGQPYYIKIDIEHYDQVVLENLFANNICPPYISAESHTVDVFCIFVAQGHYRSFKIIDGKTVHDTYHRVPIQDNLGNVETFSFPFHAAGPFGEDVKGEWLSAENCMKVLAYQGLGWKDLHATNIHEPASERRIKFKSLVIESSRNRIRKKLRTIGILRS
jgi:FkbM family methyltransferase